MIRQRPSVSGSVEAAPLAKLDAMRLTATGVERWAA
jgi:hypothetical protein